VKRLALIALLALVSCVQDVGPGARPLLPGGAKTKGPAPKPAGGPVFAIGDSLLVGALNHGGLEAGLTEDGWEPETLAENGRSARWAVNQVGYKDTVPRYVLIVLGSNPGFSSDGFADDVTDLRDELVARGARRILWLPPHHPDPERYRMKLEILADADRADGALSVPDWGAVLDEHPEWVNSDGIHLSEEGYIAMAAFIRDALARLG
jgi:lysophospholipase L1-like esterase